MGRDRGFEFLDVSRGSDTINYGCKLKNIQLLTWRKLMFFVKFQLPAPGRQERVFLFQE